LENRFNNSWLNMVSGHYQTICKNYLLINF
jgi:hypothetical protein